MNFPVDRSKGKERREDAGRFGWVMDGKMHVRAGDKLIGEAGSDGKDWDGNDKGDALV